MIAELTVFEQITFHGFVFLNNRYSIEYREGKTEVKLVLEYYIYFPRNLLINIRKEISDVSIINETVTLQIIRVTHTGIY